MSPPDYERFAFRPRALLWVAAFLALLAGLLFPAILLSANFAHELSIWEQAGLIAAATLGVQLLRRRGPQDVTGRLDGRWARQAGLGIALGAVLMLIPAAFLALGGWVTFSAGSGDAPALMHATLLMAGVAVAEELLFRGVLFQRLIEALGAWPAQLLLAALFTLTHMGNPNMEGAVRIWAGVNIFLASLLFGLAYLKTRSLALPIGLHFMANLSQGVVLGFGVSGQAQPSLLTPRLNGAEWLTGGAFGLEASLPGVLAIAGALVVVARLRPAPASSTV